MGNTFKNLGNLTRNYAKLYVKLSLGFPCNISRQQEEGAFWQYVGLKL
jgi:hypothetical protein